MATRWQKLGVQVRPKTVHELLTSIAAITLATGNRYVWRGVGDVDYRLETSGHRRLKVGHDGAAPTADDYRALDWSTVRRARDFGYIPREEPESASLARLQHATASTSLLDVTPDPFIGLFFASEVSTGNVRDAGASALMAIRVPGKTEVDQKKHTFRGPVSDKFGTLEKQTMHEMLLAALELPDQTRDPILWEAPFLDDRMRAQRGMFLATRALDDPPDYGSIDLRLSDSEDEKRKVGNLLKHKKGKWDRPSLVVFYVSAKLRESVIRELDRRFGYRTETIYPDLAGYAQANGSTRMFHG